MKNLVLLTLLSLGASIVGAGEKSLNPVPNREARRVYQLALNQATAANKISVPEGFTVEVVRSANDNEGSWIAFEFGKGNDVFVAKEDQGILKFKFDANGELIDKKVVNAELKQCRGLLWAYDSLYVHCNSLDPDTSGIFRLQDNNDDGRFETVDHLLTGTTQSSIDQGRNQMRLGPDGKIYFMCGSNVELSNQINRQQSFLRNFAKDDLIPNPWDLDWSSHDGNAPGGHLIRMDKDGQSFQLVAGGFCNPLDVVFNRDQEMFTFDGDAEWDSALPWYKPSRILHIVGGADFGWRQGTSKWPDYYEDSLPSVVDVGLAVPTGMEFGYQSSFPKNWQNRLFVGDWVYGRIIAVDLERQGASFRSSGYQTFAFGRPLNVVDLKFGPGGHLYFVTGGRETKSAIYCVKWKGKAPEMVGDLVDTGAGDLHLLRRKLEYFHLLNENSERQFWPPELAQMGNAEKQEYFKQAVDVALENIDHDDRYIRHAARLVLENKRPELWLEQAMQSEAPAAFVAIARGGFLGDALVKRMNQIQLEKLPEDRLLAMLRAYEISFIRKGMPGADLKNQLTNKLLALFPSKSDKVNHELVELLVYLDAPGMVDKLSAMLANLDTTESLAHYLVYARYLQGGWNLETRRLYLQAIQQLEAFPGGELHKNLIERLRADFGRAMTRPEHLALSKWMKPKMEAVEPEDEEVAGIDDQRVWAVDDFSVYYNHDLSGRNFVSGKQAYKRGKCAKCHDNQLLSAVMRGPSLSQMRTKSLYELMVALVHPSRVINDKYRDPAIPNLSAMPAGLIDGLEKAQVLDLLAYLKSGGNDSHPAFRGRVIDIERLTESNLPVINEVGGEIQAYAELDLPKPPKPKLAPSLFKKNSAANTDRQRLFAEINVILKNFPSAKFEFIGHADDTQWDQTNYDISLNRARFTVDYLEYMGLPRGIMSFKGMGAKEPSDVSNRRVEIKVTY